MAASNTNHTRITEGFQFLMQALSACLARELRNAYGADWWQTAVLGKLYDDQKRYLPLSGSDEECAASLDISCCLLLFDLHWNEVFRKRLPVDCRTWAKELTGTRNRWAHAGTTDFSDSDTWRALDTMSRLCEQLDADIAGDILALLRTVRYGSAAGSAAASVQTASAPESTKDYGMLHTSPAGLPCWREVIRPHPDVAQGRYRNAEFAADLAQVARGDAALEYQDPVEFFNRTYVTEGMKALLVQAVRRVAGRDGEPVVQLKTAFGGGKTHSMLALYHLLHSKKAKEHPAVRQVLDEACVTHLPDVRVAVLVGTALDPSRSKRPQYMPGITINTLWGEMAAQLVRAAGKPKLYDIIREADKKGVSPGSEALRQLFDSCGPCLILMDELVAYARRIYGVQGLPAGSFENFISFIQEITEAARASKNSLVVASIPESNIEIGGEAGKIALETIEHTFGRMEAIWKPVAASEGFEIVRRRLFLECSNPSAREMVCQQFSALYRDNPSDFPLESKELAYKDRLLACYPIHPEVFDRLYEDWATLERFQRTRGVLRLMAAVIHELWMGNDAGLLIMPGSLPLSASSVRDELTRHLSEGWNAIVDREVDGKNSLPWQQDSSNPRYGTCLASRRVARAIMLGSAPSVRQQKVRGIEAARIRLGVVQPGESIADFNDALSSLQNTLAYLYSAGDRFWYDTRPTLRKTVEDRARQLSPEKVEKELETRLRKFSKEDPFRGIHICPSSSQDVPDDQEVRLVLLPPKQSLTSTGTGPAMEAVEEILETRGSAPRKYRNMLIFLAADQSALSSLEKEIRRYLAWQSIDEDKKALNLDEAQNDETEKNIARCDATVSARVKEAWCWLLVPRIDLADVKTVIWDKSRLSGSQESIIATAGKKLLQDEAVIDNWAPPLLLMELNTLLWKNADDVQIKTLWENLCSYCYLPRLVSYSVLENTIRNGLSSKEYFAYAAGRSEGRYLGLTLGQPAAPDKSGYLVRPDAARRQIPDPPPSGTSSGTSSTGTTSGTSSGTSSTGTTSETSSETSSTITPPPPPPPAPRPTRLLMTKKLDVTRANREVQNILQEVVALFTGEEGVSVEIQLSLNIRVPKGISKEIANAALENCRTLKIDNIKFEDN